MSMAKQDFISRWHGRRLEDWGCTVSKEFKTFQQAFQREVKRMAAEVGATPVNASNGHYDMRGFVERDGLYVYYSYSNLDRTLVDLKGERGLVFMMRSASGPKDYSGDANNHVAFTEFTETMERLLADRAQKRLMDNGGYWTMEHTDAAGCHFDLTQVFATAHVLVTAPDGTVLYEQHIEEGSIRQAYHIYDKTRRAILNEADAIHTRMAEKMRRATMRKAA